MTSILFMFLVARFVVASLLEISCSEFRRPCSNDYHSSWTSSSSASAIGPAIRFHPEMEKSRYPQALKP